jgi:polar amino acid transport system substrate-binding protein
MTLKKVFLAGWLGLAGPLSNASEAPLRLHLMTENSPPGSMREGNAIVGSGPEKIREIMARTGTAYTLELLPWRRGFVLAQQEPAGCLFSTTRTPDRENLFKWVGPTDDAEWMLLGRADRTYRMRTLEDARELRIGTYNGDARDEYLRARGFNVDPAPSDLMNPRKLLMDRIDVWAIASKRGTTPLKLSGFEHKIVPVLTFNRVQLYLACNPAVPTALIAKMNAALEAMTRDGTMKRIDRKYEKWVATAQPKP